MTYHVANYWNALQEYWQPLLRSLAVRRHRDR